VRYPASAPRSADRPDPGGDAAAPTPRAAGLAGPLTMFSPLAAIVRRQAVTVALDATVRQALETMERMHLGSVVIATADRVPLGIFTLRDLLRRVALPGGDLSQPIAGVMTSGLITLRAQATAHHAALTMARNGVGLVVVVDGQGKLLGVVSQSDLFSLRRVGVEEVGERLRAAGDLAGLVEAAAVTRSLTDSLVAQGVATETLTHLISTLNDLLTIRIIELAADAHDLPPVAMCWVAMGSEGRMEQTCATDQDNAILFEAPPSEAGAVRQALLPFARTVNEWLAACGFPLCKGQVMAGNPRWCLSLGEWQGAFRSWIAEPTPQAILDSCIAFDLRPIHGSDALVERLREWALAAVKAGSLFLRLHAEAALESAPPLGRIRDFAFDGSREFPHTIDLKRQGTRLFSDAARVLALARGVAHTSTGERLRAVADAVRLGPEELAAVLDAFHFVHRLRLRGQMRGEPAGAANRVDPRTLHRLDRHLLRESLRQAGRLQRCLSMEMGLG